VVRLSGKQHGGLLVPDEIGALEDAQVLCNPAFGAGGYRAIQLRLKLIFKLKRECETASLTNTYWVSVLRC
jgi:hypothetical protein